MEAPIQKSTCVSIQVASFLRKSTNYFLIDAFSALRFQKLFVGLQYKPNYQCYEDRRYC